MGMRPTKSEELFLSLGYNRFYELFDEIIEDDFWKKDGWYRFSKASNIFAVYSELLTYEPFRYVIEELKKKRPPMESEIGGPLFKFIRNVLAHFPVFETWDDVWVRRGKEEGHILNIKYSQPIFKMRPRNPLTLPGG